MARVVGIDLGTTNSLVALLEPHLGRAEVLDLPPDLWGPLPGEQDVADLGLVQLLGEGGLVGKDGGVFEQFRLDVLARRRVRVAGADEVVAASQ